MVSVFKLGKHSEKVGHNYDLDVSQPKNIDIIDTGRKWRMKKNWEIIKYKDISKTVFCNKS